MLYEVKMSMMVEADTEEEAIEKALDFTYRDLDVLDVEEVED